METAGNKPWSIKSLLNVCWVLYLNGHIISWYNYSSEFALLVIYDPNMEKYNFKVANSLNAVIKSFREKEVSWNSN